MKFRSTSLACIATLALAATCGLGVPNAAIADEGSFEPLTLIQEQGLLSAPGDSDLGAQINTAAPEGQGPAEIAVTPVSDGDESFDAASGAAVIEDDGFAYVTGKGSSGTNASFIVISDGEAPDSHQFEIGDASNNLQLEADGTVLVFDATGNQVNYLLAPWATDALGRDLNTYYTVDGNIVTQHIDLTDAVFPVVADPSTGCGIGWCSVYFNRAETRTIKDGGSGAGYAVSYGCARLHPAAGGACMVVLGAIVGMANVAYNGGNCVGVVGYGVPGTLLSGWGPFVEPRGTSHCR